MGRFGETNNQMKPTFKDNFCDDEIPNILTDLFVFQEKNNE